MNLKRKLVSNIHGPTKTKYIGFNNNVFMTKELRKEIMKKLKIRNKFNPMGYLTNLWAI